MQVFNLNFFSILIFLFINWIFIYIFYKFYKNQKFFWQKFSNFFSWKKIFLQFIFLYLSFFLIFLSIFSFKYFSKDEVKWKWIDVVFVLDVSKSMNAIDIKWERWIYSRLDFAKKVISDFVLKNSENRFSLIIFAWESKSSLPLTNDKNLFLKFLESVDYKNFENQWSDFWKALELANSRTLYSEEKNKAIIFISDWWENEDFIFEEISKQKMKNNSYFVLWVWTETWWKIILWQDFFWRAEYQKYNWSDVLVKINEENLKKIAETLDGKYFKIEEISDLEKIWNEFSKIEKNIFEKNFEDGFRSFSRIFWFFSFFFFVCFLIVYIFDFRKYEK